MENVSFELSLEEAVIRNGVEIVTVIDRWAKLTKLEKGVYNLQKRYTVEDQKGLKYKCYPSELAKME